ncbi:putative RNA helicase [Helianthus annuus]|nr:putative RNA helicase [Helianthus annuus]
MRWVRQRWWLWVEDDDVGWWPDCCHMAGANLTRDFIRIRKNWRGSRLASCAFVSKLVKVMVCWWLICKNNQRVEEIRQMCHIALKRHHEYIKTVEEGSEETHTQVSKNAFLFTDGRLEYMELVSLFSWKLLCYHLGSPSDFQLLSRKVSLVQRLCHIMILLLMVHCQLQGRKDLFRIGFKWVE